MPTQSFADDVAVIWSPAAIIGLTSGWTIIYSLFNGLSLWSGAAGAGRAAFVLAVATLGRWRGAV